MKYLVCLLVLLSSTVQASKDRCPIAEPSNLTGLWQAYSFETGALYELRFRKDGTSSLSASTAYGNAWVGSADEVVVNNSGLSISYLNNIDKNETVVVNGFGVSCENNGSLNLILDSQVAGHIFYYQNIKFIKGSLVNRLVKIQGKLDREK